MNTGTEARKSFANTEVASKYEYTGNWTVNDKEKRLNWPGTYDGLFCEIKPEVAQKLLDSQYPGLKLKAEASAPAAAKKNAPAT